MTGFNSKTETILTVAEQMNCPLSSPWIEWAEQFANPSDSTGDQPAEHSPGDKDALMDCYNG